MKTKLLLTVLLLCRLGIGQEVKLTEPKPQITKTHVALVAFDYTSSLFDAYTSSSKFVISCGYEMNPIYGRHPSDRRYYGQMLSQTTVIAIASYFLIKHHHRKLAYIGMVADGSAHLIGVGQNAINCR